MSSEMITKKRILQMNHAELRALTAIVLPGRSADELRSDEMQELCFKWLFANGLSINHVFELHRDADDDAIFCVMRNSEPCWCCPKQSENALKIDSDPSSIAGQNQSIEKRSPTPPPLIATHRIAPIVVQPTIFRVETPPTCGGGMTMADEEKKKPVSRCTNCRRECGYCILNLCQQC